jgi:hypothetical protein
MNEEKMLDHVRSKCYEVIQLREIYEDYKTKLIEETNDVKQIIFWLNDIGRRAEQTNAYYNQYIQANRDLSQLCHILDGKYLEMFNELVEGEE